MCTLFVMEYVSVRDFRGSSAQVWKTLERDGRMVVTSNGRPRAIVIEADSSNLDDKLRLLNQAELMWTMETQWAKAREAGLDQVPMAEIDAEIAVARAEQRAE